MSSFLGFCEWNTRNRWRDGQVCPDVDKELWRLGSDGSGVFWRWTSVSRCGQGTMASWARRLEWVLACYAPIRRRRSRDFGDLRIRRSEGRVENAPLVFKRVLFQATRGDPKEKKRGGDPKGEVGEKSSEKRRADRLRKRRGESQSFAR
ncbi:hypothetical protein TNCV_1226741 [Trichonephila clavipes]|nr:hypothetical protein TNCV_1226741 [Trichonephila clavipes]